MHLVFHLYVHIIEKGSSSSEFMTMNSMKFYSLTQLGRFVGQINNRHNRILDTFQVYFGTWSLSCFRRLQFSFFSRHTNTTKEILGQVLQVQCSLTANLGLAFTYLGLGLAKFSIGVGRCNAAVVCCDLATPRQRQRKEMTEVSVPSPSALQLQHANRKSD